MSTRDDDGNNSTAVALAVISGGAVLLWLLLRGRGKGGRGSSGGTASANGDGGGSSGTTPVHRHVLVRVLVGDRIELDGLSADLETTVASARAAGHARFETDGAVRLGFVSKVLYALLDAGVDVDGAWDTVHDTPRFDGNGRVLGNVNPSFANPAAAEDSARSLLNSSSRRDADGARRLATAPLPGRRHR